MITLDEIFIIKKYREHLAMQLTILWCGFVYPHVLTVMFKDYPGEIYMDRKDSSMILGVTDGECYVASEIRYRKLSG